MLYFGRFSYDPTPSMLSSHSESKFKRHPTTDRAIKNILNEIANTESFVQDVKSEAKEAMEKIAENKDVCAQIKEVNEFFPWQKDYSVDKLVTLGVDKELLKVEQTEPKKYSEWWNYLNPLTVPGFLAGGVGRSGAPHKTVKPSVHNKRIITGKVTVSIDQDGKAKLVSNFQLQIEDAFNFDPAGHGPNFLTAAVVDALGLLEKEGLTFDVLFKTNPFQTNNQTVPLNIDIELPEVPTEEALKECDEEEESESVASWDPNDKTSPAGKGEENYIGQGTPLMPYKIRFENKKEASAPAVLVRVTDILDEDLDLSTLELTEITFADQVISVSEGLSHYETHKDLIIDNEFVNSENIRVKVEADLNLETRTLDLVITGVDPQTGWIPADPFLGFLYPNDDKYRGAGSLSYIVRPKEGLADETKITNQAIIFFDWNDPIETNEVLNTIGEVKHSPTIVVTEPDGIDDKANASFTITWTDKAPENDALISIYYDTNRRGEDGTLIVSNIEAADETNRYTWQTSALPEGDYYIYAVINDGVHAPVIDYSEDAVTIFHKPKLLVELSHFVAIPTSAGVSLNWETQTERDSQGFRIWRAEGNSNGEYTNVTLLKELTSSQAVCVEGQLIAATGSGQNQLITAIGNSIEGACYSFKDSSPNEEGTYYYVLEEIEMSGKRTFHCNDMDAITIGQSPVIDLTAASLICRQAEQRIID
jgi:hypothetical protein